MARFSEPSDHKLLERARSGDAQSFGDFYKRRRGLVLAFLRPRVGSADLAADLMCETFSSALIAVHDRERQLPPAPVAWLITIARHQLLDSYRRGRVAEETRRRLALDPVVLTDEDLIAVDDAAADADLLRELEEELPEDQFLALKARVLDERGYPEIAGELQCSEAVVRKRVSRALTNLRQRRGVDYARCS